MSFIMPVLVDVLEARYAGPGNPKLERVPINYEIVVTNHCGNPEPETIPYTRDVNEEWLPDGRLYDFGLEIDSWVLSRPDFEIAEYVAPPEPAPPTPAEKLAAAGLTVEDLKALLKE